MLRSRILCSAMFLIQALFGAAMGALAPPTHPLFEEDAVNEIHLTFHQPDWWELLRENFEGQEDPEYLPGEFDWETVHFDSIGVRFKGNSSYNGYPGVKKSFKLDIDEYVTGQEIHGLDKLNLNNGFMDPSFVREKACYELCAAAGLPTERTNYAALFINGEYWGLYTLVEQYDQEFIESRFGPSEEGNLWKGDPHGTLEYLGPYQASYYSSYELENNTEQNDWSALVEMVDALNNSPIASLPDTLHSLMDVNSALAMLAIDNLTVNLDSYIGRCCNYYFYHRDLDGRFVFAQWDLNEAWGIFNMWNMSLGQLTQLSPFWVSTQPGEQRPLAERLWQVDAYEEIYLGHFRSLMAGAAQPDRQVARMEELRDLIRPFVYADDNKMFTNAQFEGAMTSNIYVGPRLIPALETLLRDRDAWLRGQIGSWSPPEGLVLNELMASNDHTITDEHGDYDDWIEVANVGAAPIDLLGLGLADHHDGSAVYAFPAIILEPGEYLVVWADDQPQQGSMHAPFKLDADGEDVYLLDGAVIVDQITFPSLGVDQSWGRWPDGDGAWQLLSEATPGAENLNPQQPEEIILFINEFMALNASTIQDEQGEYEDWVEIYNPGPADVQMGGLYLTDELANTTQWAFPDTSLAAGGFLLVWCDDDEEDGPLHTNFRLSGDGEEIGLFGRLTAGNPAIDGYQFGAQTTDVSEGRETDGGAAWVYFVAPTPGASNGASAGIGESLPRGLCLLPNQPNPFAVSTTLSFHSPVSGRALLEIYDLQGRRVAILIDAGITAGRHMAIWDGRDSAGRIVAPGIYLSRLTLNRDRRSQRVICMR